MSFPSTDISTDAGLAAIGGGLNFDEMGFGGGDIDLSQYGTGSGDFNFGGTGEEFDFDAYLNDFTAANGDDGDGGNGF